MAKRYQVKKTFTLGTPSDPDEFVVNEQWDLALSLSQRLQRNVRQGRVFNIHSVQAQLVPPHETGNQDLGLAFTGALAWCPATKNSASAWRHAFKVWQRQKQLAVNAVGGMVRYDDFEVAWGSDKITPRTSTLYAEGFTDSDTESVVIYGDSLSGLGVTNRVTLEDIYESARPQSSPSRFPLSNVVVKESKFTAEFPPSQSVPLAASWSAIDAQTGHDAGAQIQAPKTYISDGKSLCGVLNIHGYCLPENVAGTEQDDLLLVVTLEVSIGSSLAAPSSRPIQRRSTPYKRKVWDSPKARHYKKRMAWKRYRK